MKAIFTVYQAPCIYNFQIGHPVIEKLRIISFGGGGGSESKEAKTNLSLTLFGSRFLSSEQ